MTGFDVSNRNSKRVGKSFFPNLDENSGRVISYFLKNKLIFVLCVHSILIKLLVSAEFFSNVQCSNSKFMLPTETKQFRVNTISITKPTNHHKALMGLTIINKHEVSQNLRQFFEFIQSLVDIGNSLQPFVSFCSEESNKKVRRLFHTVLLNCDTHPSNVA